jgi:signal transduction histidine kinase
MSAEAVSLNRRSKLWLGSLVSGLSVFIFAALVLPRSFLLTALTDVVQALLLVSGTASFIPLALRSRGRLRVFWSLIVAGLSLWLIYQLFWTWYEVVLRREVPDLFAGDIVLFLHVVPMMAALALRPHIRRDEYTARLGHLDFAMLLVWWIYLYCLIVIPWQYAVPDLTAYNRNLNVLYLSEKGALLLLLGACWAGSHGKWRTLYGSLFGMTVLYSASSAAANMAIARDAYYSGSVYDIPLALAMAWVTWIGLSTAAREPETEVRQDVPAFGVWMARSGMIAVLSLPLLAAWAVTDASSPSRIRVFRLVMTLLAALLMGVIVFVRQYMLDSELVELLQYSREAFDNLTRLQAQVLQSEKLASIGQLVGGAAHELNNPLTAMLGYSDLLLGTALDTPQRDLALQIGRDVRRTKSLVASLISFARQAPAPKSPVDLNTLVRTAIKLSQPQWESLEITVQTFLDPKLPRVLGDSNQLLQVCLQLVGHLIREIESRGDILSVRTEQQGIYSVLGFAVRATAAVVGPERSAKHPVAIGLSACEGIIQEHGGAVAIEQDATGLRQVRLQLPALEATTRSKDANLPLALRSQPFA